MSTDTVISPEDAVEQATLRAVLCGSFRRDPVALRATFEELDQAFVLLAPRTVDFVDHDVAFVRLVDEADEPASVIEQRHLDAISAADFVWLHAPNGYVGTSASMEVGYANALGIPIFSDTCPTDEVIAAMVRIVQAPAQVTADDAVTSTTKPGAGIAALQNYYGRAAERRGWSSESARDTLLLLTEEMGELARAVRKHEGLARSGGYEEINLGHEVADVQLYLVHLANSLGVDLSRAVSEKERINADRAKSRPTLTTVSA